MRRFYLDYETFGTLPLDEVGAHRYAEEPTTEILLAAIASDTEGPYLWVNPRHATPGLVDTDPRARELLSEAFCARPDAVVYAHNAQFERVITQHCSARDLCLPPLPLASWRCSAAVARRAGLPGKLERLCTAMGLEQGKDVRGKKLINLFSKLQENGRRTDPKDFPIEFAEFGDYCLQDARVERTIMERLLPFELRGELLEAFFLDSYINDLGFPMNRQAIQNALRISDRCIQESADKFLELTGGLKITQREKIRQLLADLGAPLPNMQGATLQSWEKRTASEVPERARELIRLYSELNYAAVKKLPVMLSCLSADDRARGTLMFYGAGTGRWSGRRIQPQNLKKPTIGDTTTAYRCLCEGVSREDLEILYGNPIEVISSCIRHFIQMPNGVALLDADYSAIEARIVCWLAGQTDAVERFRDGVDSYRHMAGYIYQMDPEEIKNPSPQRDLGKMIILGCGFGMGPAKFLLGCRSRGLTFVDASMAERAVTGYRQTHPKVRSLWLRCDKAARSAIALPGKRFPVGEYLSFEVRTIGQIPFLLFRLPSGRSLAYPHPRIELSDKTGDREITFYGQLPGSQLWGRCKTYGAKLAENATQGTAFDVMAHGGARAWEEGFRLITLVHDQALAEDAPGRTPEQFRDALTQLPAWAVGLPLTAEAKRVPYYRK